MDFYIDLRLQADEEIPIHFIRNKVFTKFHKALHEQKETVIGVSFPKYKEKLGDIIRIHGEKSRLNALQEKNWLGGLAGYCEVSDILPIPEKIKGYRTVSRVRQNMSNAKLNRLIKRETILAENIPQYKAKMFQHGLDNPYLELESASNGQKYRRYIQFGKLKTESTTGIFDTFGFSNQATIPWF